MKNRFLLLHCITIGAFSFPTPIFIFLFMANYDLSQLSYAERFLLITMLLLAGAIVGVAYYYKDSAVATLKDWYPSDRP